MPPKSKTAQFQPSGETTRVISCGGGTHAYVFDLKGKTHHVRTDSTEIVDLLRELNEQTGSKTIQELERLGWTDLIEKVTNEKPAAETE